MLRPLVSRKTLLIIGSILFALAALVVLIWRHFVEEEREGRVAWETYRAAAERRGVKLFIRDMIPPDVPDEENYAAIPVIREMFAERKTGAESGAPFAFPRSKEHPKFGNFSSGVGTDLGAWRTFLLKGKLLDAPTEDVPGDILRALEKFEQPLQQLRNASARPRCKFPTRWENGLDTKMPHLPPLLGAENLFALRMEALLAKGDSAAALSEFRHGMRLSETLVPEPSTIVSLARLSMLSRLERAVWNGLAAHRWSEGDLVALEKDLTGIRLLDEFQAAIESERGHVPEFFLNLTTKSSREILKSLEFGTSDSGAPDNSLTLTPSFVKKGGIYHNVIAMHEGIDALLAPYKAAKENGRAMIMGGGFTARAWLASRAASAGKEYDCYSMAHLFMSTFASIEKRFLETSTNLQQTVLACALERFWIKHQAFPEILDELVPQFIVAVPQDIGDGKPLHYRRNPEGGYDIWSIGADRKDDAGVFDPSKKETEQDDWLWHMPGPPKTP